MIDKLRYILLPFSIIYSGIIRLRHYLYDKKILKSAEFNFPIICVGNLALGGTGKTPMTEYLIGILRSNYKVATLSRGYKRKTKGYVLANEHTTALEIGDEPMQFHQKFKDVAVAVGEERVSAIPQLLYDRHETDVIILDDAFQHRQVNAGLNILLTQYDDLYTRDLLLPAGNLRDIAFSSKRAHIIVVSKCPENITDADRKAVLKKLSPEQNQQVYFTKIEYSAPYHLYSGEEFVLTKGIDVLLICGVANPTPLLQYLEHSVADVNSILYSDHHIFDLDDLEKIKNRFNQKSGNPKIILTTEKDAMRLFKFRAELEALPVFLLPIKHNFLFDGAESFNEVVIDFIRTYKR